MADQHYFRRIEAIEFTIAHDDGRNPQELSQADIVLLGVSRSSKTPTVHLPGAAGLQGVQHPARPVHRAPEARCYEVDRTRLFGLMTTADVLVGIRQRRLGNASRGGVATMPIPNTSTRTSNAPARSCANSGAIVIHTENRAVEETAQEILRYYERAHPQGC